MSECRERPARSELAERLPSGVDNSHHWLAALTNWMGSRSAALWTLDGLHLSNLGHAFADDVAAEFRQDIEAHTTKLRLSNVNAGPVQAVMNRSPIVHTTDRDDSRVSACLDKIGAYWLISCPVVRDFKIIAVVAVALSREVGPEEAADELVWIAQLLADRIIES